MAPRLPVNLIFAHLLALELRCPVQSSSTRNQFSVLDATVSCTNLSRSCTQFLGFSTIDQYGAVNEEASNEMVICMKEFIPWVRTSAFVPLLCSRRAATASTCGGGPRFGRWRAQAGARRAGVAAHRGLVAVALSWRPALPARPPPRRRPPAGARALPGAARPPPLSAAALYLQIRRVSRRGRVRAGGRDRC